MAEKKITKKEMFMEVLDIVIKASIEEEKRDRLNEFILHEIDLLDKKASTSKNRKSADDEILETAILETLSTLTKGVQIKELLTLKPLADIRINLLPVSSPKASSVMQKLIKADKVTREEIKKVAYFKLKKE